jgi:hypothetical protein
MLFRKETKQCLFEPTKTGTRTAQDFLRAAGWAYLGPDHGYPDDYLAKYPNLSEYKAHCFLRNPLDRFVSTVLFLKQYPSCAARVQQVIDENGIAATVETLSYDQFVDHINQFKAKFPIMLEAQSRWMTLPGTEVLDFDNYEAEIRRISGDYDSPLGVMNKTTDFGKSVVTQKVIDFVRQEYAADYALAKDQLGKEYNP